MLENSGTAWLAHRLAEPPPCFLAASPSYLYPFLLPHTSPPAPAGWQGHKVVFVLGVASRLLAKSDDLLGLAGERLAGQLVENADDFHMRIFNSKILQMQILGN